MTIESISMTSTATTVISQSECSETNELQESTAPINELDTDVLETDETADSEEPNGVLRLLQEGHFKGVADVRLRINFFNEIQELESQNLIEAAEEGFETFNESVQAESTTLSESELLDEPQTEAVNAFLNEVETAQGEFLESAEGAEAVEPLIANLQNSFDALAGVLSGSTAPADENADTVDPQTDSPEPAAETLDTAPATVDIDAVVVDSVTTPESEETSDPLGELVQNFQQAIQSFIDKLESDLSVSSFLPPISEPAGNGKAYAKFVSIYEEMQSMASTDADPVDSLDALEGAEPAEPPAEELVA